MNEPQSVLLSFGNYCLFSITCANYVYGFLWNPLSVVTHHSMHLQFNLLDAGEAHEIIADGICDLCKNKYYLHDVDGVFRVAALVSAKT